MRLSLRHRLLLVPLLLLLGTAAATAYTAWHAARAAEDRIRGRIDAIIQTLRGPPTFPLTSPVLRQMTQLTGAQFALDAPNNGLVSIDNDDYWAETVELTATHPNAGQKVTVLFPESIRRGEIRSAVTPVLLLGLGGGLLATLISLVVGRRLVNRIRRIEEGTRAIAEGRFEPLALPADNDELRDLTASVNAMAGQLAANSETLKQDERLKVLGQITGGLAHQLRNAATGAKLAVELARSGSDGESLDVAGRQLQRMESILKQFLELSRPDPRPKADADLRDIVGKSIELLRPQAEHQHINVRWHRPAAPIIRAIDAGQFGHLMENLLQNACDAAGPGGEVAIRLDESGLEVTDSGPGPPDAVAAKLFEPFITSKPGGIGLGLMVARQAAEAHGATLTWNRIADQTVFRVQFASPVAAEDLPE